MTDSGKRKINAREIVTDIRSGMDGSALKSKYQLSDKALESVCSQLSSKGILTDQERRRLQPVPPSTRSIDPQYPEWRCPACNANQASHVRECPACGIVIDKFVARQQQEQANPGVPRISTHDPDSMSPKNWMTVIASVVILALVGGAVIAWSTYRAKQKTKMTALGIKLQSAEPAPVQPNFVPEQTDGDQSQNAGSQETGPAESGELRLNSRTETEIPRVPSPPQPASTPPPPASMPYVTGVLRQFTFKDFKREVVEASNTCPVLFQFYSDT